MKSEFVNKFLVTKRESDLFFTTHFGLDTPWRSGSLHAIAGDAAAGVRGEDAAEMLRQMMKNTGDRERGDDEVVGINRCGGQRRARVHRVSAGLAAPFSARPR